MKILKPLLLVVLLVYFFSNVAYAQHLFKGTIKDAKTGEQLAFATITNVNSNRGTISNSDGYFEFRTAICPLTIEVSYIGYSSSQLKLTNEMQHRSIEILLEPSPFTLSDVNVVHEDYIVELLKKARRKNVQYISKARQGKSFFRFHSTADEKPIEFFEGFYNVESSVDGIHRIMFKSGKHQFANLPDGEGYFATTYLSPIMLFIRLFTKGEDVFSFPDFPLQFTSKKWLRELFTFSYTASRLDKMLIHEISFQAKTDEHYHGVIYVDSLLQLKKIECYKKFKDSDQKPIIPQSDGEIIGPMTLNYKMSFELIDDEPVLSHAFIDYNYTYVNSSSDTFTIATSVSNSNFDYDKRFSEPQYPSIYKGHLADLLLSSITPFFDEIYNYENVIVRSKKEQDLCEVFEQEEPVDLSYWFPVMLIEPWTPGSKIDTLRLARKSNFGKPTVNGGAMRRHPVYDKFYIETFNYYDYICYEQQPRFTSETMIDYYNSYSIASVSDSLFREVMLQYFNLDKLYALKTEHGLLQTYKSKCPSPRELDQLERKFARLKEAERTKFNDMVQYFGKDQIYDFNLLDNCKYAMDIMKLKMELERMRE